MEHLSTTLPAPEEESWRRAIKLVISGPFAAGKTQFIATASDIEPLQTEVQISEENAAEKSTTTVALDFGKLTLAPWPPIYLFGTPGQERFQFMWEILAIGMQGLILLIDATNPATAGHARAMLEHFQQHWQVPILVCATKQDLPGAQSPEAINAALQLPEAIPLLPVCAIQKDSVIQAIKAIIERINHY